MIVDFSDVSFSAKIRASAIPFLEFLRAHRRKRVRILHSGWSRVDVIALDLGLCRLRLQDCSRIQDGLEANLYTVGKRKPFACIVRCIVKGN